MVEGTRLELASLPARFAFCFVLFVFLEVGSSEVSDVGLPGSCVGRPIIMTHIGRPYDKKTKTLTVKQDESVDAVVAYLQRKLRIKFAVPQFHVTEKEGIQDIDTSINWLIQDLRARKIGGIYLPNTRWFAVSNLALHTCTYISGFSVLR